MASPDRHSTDPDDLRMVAVAVADSAGALLADGLHGDREVTTKSTATDMVTEMDRASEALVVATLERLRPDDGILGEEGTDRAGTTGVRWVIDPLDGTTNYVYRYPGWNVSVGAEIDGVPVAGAVAIPGLRETFSGATGVGAFCNDRPIRIGPAAPLGKCLVGTGFNYDAGVRVVQAETIRSFIGSVRDIRRGGAAAADLCSVAAGRLDAYLEHGLAPWDWTAGTAIARAAGARVETWTVAMTGTFTAAAHPDRFDELVSLFAATGSLA